MDTGTENEPDYNEEEDEMPDMDNGDEAISLYDVLAERDNCLNEEELWAMCRECCLVLEVVNSSPEMFLTLCVTPDTVAFDGAGNVCFLDLDKEPEALYIPPEYGSDTANTYKSHLFSLGMTLLYAAEYNGTPRGTEISGELRDLFGCMTAEDVKKRPDLEALITQCEEELCGKSSQEVCCGIASFVGSYTPEPDVNSVSLADVTEGLANYLHSQTSLVQGPDSHTIPGPQQHSTPSASPFVNIGASPYRQEEDSPYSLQESVAQAEGDMPMRGLSSGMPIPTGNRERNNNKRGQAKSGLNYSSNLYSSVNSLQNYDSDAYDKKTSLLRDSVKDSVLNSARKDNGASHQNSKDEVLEYSDQNKQPKPQVPLKPSPIKFETSKKFENDSGMVDDSNFTFDVETSLTSKVSSNLNDEKTVKTSPRTPEYYGMGCSSDTVSQQNMKTSPQTPEYYGIGSSSSTGGQQFKDKVKSVENKLKDKAERGSHAGPDVQRSESEESNSVEAKPRRSKKKQGLTINEVLDSLNRDLTEEELWALCREGALALQRKKKHLPAYLSPDTLLMRENGILSFKAIPEDKPLEVIFMAPELQQKGQLSEKSCLYGLGVTLRCAGGKKYSSATSLDVSSELQNFLYRMAESDSARRPSLEETIKFCDSHEKSTGTLSNVCCKDLFQEAFTKLMDQTNVSNALPKPVPEKSKTKPKPPPKPPSPMLSAFRPLKAATSKPQISSGSAFAPIPVKPEPKVTSSIPTAYTSSATHFKPIVLHQNTSEETTGVKDQGKTTEEKVGSKEDLPNEKDKEVVRKLKELKKNLMKHRQPGMAKEIENEDKEPNSMQNSPEKKTSTAPTTTQELEKASEADVKLPEQKPSSSLDTLLIEMQKKGGVLDTQTLASAIAQHLQNILPQGVSNSPLSSNQKPDASHVHLNQMNPAQVAPHQSQVFQNLSSQLPHLNIPTQYQQQLLGQTMTLPALNQYGAGMMPGYPMQVQLQQDPRTGFFQLVPAGLMPMAGSSVQGSCAASDEYQGPDEDMNESVKSSKLGSKAGSDTLPRARHGRTARDLVQKTANVRAKNIHQSSPNISSRQAADSVPYRPRSVHSIDNPGADILNISSHNAGFGLMSGSGENNEQYPTTNQTRRGQGVFNSHQDRTNRSNSSSPSPSKDSGVSGLNGLNGVYNPPPPGSLMERLLNSNVSLNQQQKIGRVVHLLREEFAFDGYMENGVEDVNMAEYITSLGNLKWETFISAITEKYPDLYWGVDLLVNMYESINGVKPVINVQSSNLSAYGGTPSNNNSPQRSTAEGDNSDPNKPRPFRKRNADTAFNRQRGIRENRPSSAHAMSPSCDTSDSTDTESVGRKTRNRKKHFEKAKSASMHNLAMDPSLTAKKEDSKPESSTNIESNHSKPSQPASVNAKYTPLSANTHINVSSTVPLNSNQQRRRSDASSVKRDDSRASDIPQGYHKNTSVNNNSSLSSRSSSMTDVRNTTKLTRHISQLSLSEGTKESATQYQRNHIIYHYSMMQLSMTEEVEKFVQDIDEENADKLQNQLASILQQIMMERRTKRKTQTFYNRLSDNPKAMKGDQKNQVSKDLEEMTKKIRFLHLCQTHIEMLQSELHSIDQSYLYSLATNPHETAMKLKPCQENPLLQFHSLREPQSGCEIQVVQAGTVEGLASYLFASTALSFGYVHQFFFGFRYFTTARELFKFLRSRYTMVSKCKIREANFIRIQKRVVDLLHFWIEGFYSIDFEENSDLQQDVHMFLQQYKISGVSDAGQKLHDLYISCQEGHSIDLMSCMPAGDNVHIYKPESQKKV